MKWILLSTMFALTSGCGYWIPLTGPPPTRVAQLADGEFTISKGVALAFECRDGNGIPCTGVEATVDDPQVADVRLGYLAHQNQDLNSHHPQATQALVLIGLREGTTMVRASTDTVDLVAVVRVVP